MIPFLIKEEMSGYSYAKQRSAAKAHPEWMEACSSRCGGGTAPSVPFPDGLETDGILYHHTSPLADGKRNEEKTRNTASMKS